MFQYTAIGIFCFACFIVGWVVGGGMKRGRDYDRVFEDEKARRN